MEKKTIPLYKFGELKEVSPRAHDIAVRGLRTELTELFYMEECATIETALEDSTKQLKDNYSISIERFYDYDFSEIWYRSNKNVRLKYFGRWLLFSNDKNTQRKILRAMRKHAPGCISDNELQYLLTFHDKFPEVTIDMYFVVLDGRQYVEAYVEAYKQPLDTTQVTDIKNTVENILQGVEEFTHDYIVDNVRKSLRELYKSFPSDSDNDLEKYSNEQGYLYTSRGTKVTETELEV